jgi:hypothetical protein
MQVRTLDDVDYEWKIPDKVIQGNTRKTSSYHGKAKEILLGLYPMFAIYEEVPIRVKNRKTLYLDFYIQTLNLAIEIHGAQHYAFSSLFHSSGLDFIRQRRNDEMKEEWCELNDISFLALDYRETKLWKDLIEHYEY